MCEVTRECLGQQGGCPGRAGWSAPLWSMTLPLGDAPEATTSATGRGLVPSWLPAVLVTAAVPGVLMSLVAFWWCFVGSGPYMDPSLPGPSDIRFADRAGWWLDLGVSVNAFATLVALGAFGWASAQPAPQPGSQAGARLLLRRSGAVLAGVMAALMTWGLVAVVVGEVGLRQDPTAARDAWITTNQFRVPSLVSSLMLAVLFAAVTWGLWPYRGGQLQPPQMEPAELETLKPAAPADRPRPDTRIPPLDAEVHWQEDDAEAHYRRPRGQQQA